MEKYDFSGWATRNDLLCVDGRTIKKMRLKTRMEKPFRWFGGTPILILIACSVMRFWKIVTRVFTLIVVSMTVNLDLLQRN